MISVSASRGDKTSQSLNRMKRGNAFAQLEKWADEGVRALKANTPVSTGLAADSWRAEVFHKKGRYSIVWSNTDIEGGIPVVILLQYGHATRGGTYIQGRDFINPVILPLFDKIADEVWKEVTRG